MWVQGGMTIPSNPGVDNYVEFVAIVGSAALRQSNIAIDDLRIHSGPCNTQGETVKFK